MSKFQKLQAEYYNKGLYVTYSRYYGAYLITPVNTKKCLKNEGVGECSFKFLKVYDKSEAYNLQYVLEMVKSEAPNWL